MIHAKITPRTEADGSVVVNIEWVEVNNDPAIGPVIGKVVAQEDFRLGPARAGTAYITRVGFTEGNEAPQTFFVDAEGKRHFVAKMKAGHEKVTGLSIVPIKEAHAGT